MIRIWSRMVIHTKIVALILLSRINGKDYDLTPLIFKLRGTHPRDPDLFESNLKTHLRSIRGGKK